jgi:lauroyl/myristoyl acyltransferase
VIIFRLISYVPKFCLPFLAFLPAFLTLVFNKRAVRTLKQNVQKVYGLPPISKFSSQFARQVLQCQGFIALETIRYIFRPEEVLIEGLEHAKTTLERASYDSGVVIIAAHHGAWELAGHCAAKLLPRDFYALAKPSRSKWFTHILNEFRNFLGMKVLWTDSKSLLKEMMTIAHDKNHLGFVMDQRPGKKRGGFPCTFLKVPATPMVQGPALMAAKKNLPVIGIHAIRIDFCRYKFFATEVLPANHGETDEHKITQMMADDLSQMILRYPEQWAWTYRRWK